MSKKVKQKTDWVLKYKMPEWLEKDFLLPLQSGMAHMFIFYGDTDGLVLNPDCEDEPDNAYILFREFLRNIFSERQMVIFYDVSYGMRFLTQAMETEFKKLCGLEQDDAASADPVAAAKAGLAAKRGLPQDPNSCLSLIEKALYRSENMAMVIKSAHFIAPNPGTNGLLPANERINIQTLRNWSQSQKMRAANNIILLLTDEISKVSSELRNGGSEIFQVFIPKPTKEEREDFIGNAVRVSRQKEAVENELKKLKTDLKKTKGKASKTLEKALKEEIEYKENQIKELEPDIVLPSDFETAVFAHAAQGMSFRQINEIFLQARKTGGTLGLNFVKERKRTILNGEYGELMEIVDARRGFEDIGGLDYIKNYLALVLEAIKTGEYRKVPMGIYFMGPPGTGKTALVEALAKEAEFNFIKTKNVRSMWVGESEARMQKFIYALRSLTPVVVMNDEADLADAQRDAPKGDSGVSERLMKMWMEFLSDPRIRGQVVVISCTNRPDRIDPALKRSGRGDQRILIPMPSVNELPDIFRVMFKRYDIPTSIKDFKEFAKRTDGFSGADVEAIVLTAFRFAGASVDASELNRAIDDFIPSASQVAIDSMTEAGLLECSSRLLLPPNTKSIVEGIMKRGLIENPDYFLAQIRARRIIDI